MAVAGLRNVSVLDPSFRRESRWCDIHDRPRTTHALSLLQIWRELESEPAVIPSQLRPESGLLHQRSYGSNSDTSDESFCERQDSDVRDSIDCEYHNANGHEDQNFSSLDHSTDLGEAERGRVRQISQELKNSGLRGHVPDVSHSNHRSRAGCRKENTFEVGEGSVINCCGISAPRKMRRLCGRQTLVDLLVKAEHERHKELQDLSDRQPVANFAHRNRIQALLRGRFLLNGRLVQDERPSSVAASELGLLRQRNTVSGLREGFLSKMDNFVCGRSRSAESDTSSNNDVNDSFEEQIQSNTLQADMVEIEEQSEPCNSEIDIKPVSAVQEDGNDAQNSNQLDANSLEEQFEGEERDQIQSFTSMSNEIIGVLQNEGEELYEPEATQVIPDCDASDVPSNQVEGYEISIFEDNSEFRGWREGYAVDVDAYRSRRCDEWYQELSVGEEEKEEVDHPSQEFDDFLQSPNREEASEGRLDAFNYAEGDNMYNSKIRELLRRRSVSNLLQSDFCESLDHVVQSYVERQAQSSMDWEVEETFVPASSPALEEEVELLDGSPNQAQSEASAELAPVTLSLLPLTSSLPFLDQELQGSIWSQNGLHETFGMEWEIINDLRIEMTRLQQQMNNMQRMLEACMDMQLELQHSVRQEVSVALNWSSGSTDVDDCLRKDDSKWDHVRKGICCVCFTKGIDSLLSRCGHMCTCSKCADKLVQERGKCPMCRAPVIEMICAYSIQ